MDSSGKTIKMNYQKLSQLYEELGSTTKRLEKIQTLSEFIKHLPEKGKEVLYLIQGEVFPEYDENKIGISEQLAIKALTQSTGETKNAIVKEWKKIGDLGEVAQKLTKTKKQTTLHSKTLTTQKVLENLKKLSTLEGKGTVTKKLALITELLTSASPTESKYIIRTLLQDLRIGVQESTIRESLAKAFFPKNEKASEIVQSAIDKSNDLAVVFEVARKKKIKDLQKINLCVGKPIKAMLAQKTETFETGFKELGKPCAIEYKYDGFRLLIHKNKNEIKLFTRRLENVTKQFPEVVDYIKKHIKGDSFIMDSEAVGFDKKTKRYTEFQSISQRIRRKYNIEKLQKAFPVEVNVFDIIHYNGKSLMDEPFKKRSEILRKIIKNHPYKLIAAKQIITSDAKKAEKFYKAALKDNQEGVMMKNLDAEYKPGRRVGHMLKIKPDQRDFDLVITGAEYGTGKRSGVLSSFILSCKDEKTNKYLEVGKMSTGLKEKKTEKSKEGDLTYEELTSLILPLIKKETGRRVEVKPKVVLAVTYQEIQLSPNYNSKLALRFPRFVALREDKPLSEITTLSEIQAELKHQKKENFRYG